MPVTLSPAHLGCLQAAVAALVAPPEALPEPAWARRVAATVATALDGPSAIVAIGDRGKAVRSYDVGEHRSSLSLLADPLCPPAGADVHQTSDCIAYWTLTRLVAGTPSIVAAGLRYEDGGASAHCACMLPAPPHGRPDAGRLRALLDFLAPVFAAGARARVGSDPPHHPPGAPVGVTTAAAVDHPASDALAAALAEDYGLTARETEVARLLLRGWTNAAMSRALGISESTARHHTEHVIAKLGVRSRAEVPWLALGHLATTPGEAATVPAARPPR